MPTPQTAQQQGGTPTSGQQQGQSGKPAPQQGQPIFKDWASI